MAGFDLYAVQGTVRFGEETNYPGAEFVVRLNPTRMQYETFLALGETLGETDEEREADTPGDRQWAWFRENALISWNLEAHGQPVALTEEPLMAGWPQLRLAVMRAWVGRIGEVPRPLARR